MTTELQETLDSRSDPRRAPVHKGHWPRNPFLVIAMILAAVIFINLMFSDEPSVEISYSELEAYVIDMPIKDHRFLDKEKREAPKTSGEPPFTAAEGGQMVERVLVSGSDLRGSLYPSAEMIEAKRWDEDVTAKGKVSFRCKLPNNWELVRERFLSRGIEITVEEQWKFTLFWIWAIPVLFLAFLIGRHYRPAPR